MSTITARLPDRLNDDLDKLAIFQDRSKSNVIKRAIAKYVVEHLEDIEDIIDAERAIEGIESGELKTMTLEEFEKEYDLAD